MIFMAYKQLQYDKKGRVIREHAYNWGTPYDSQNTYGCKEYYIFPCNLGVITLETGHWTTCLVNAVNANIGFPESEVSTHSMLIGR